MSAIRFSGEYMMSMLDLILDVKCCTGSKDGCCEGYAASLGNIEEYLRERIASAQAQAQHISFSGKRILVVDDMKINREIAAEMLKKTDAAAEFAEDGQICLEKVEAAPAGYYDLILMDIMMPRLDGLEATRRIRRLPDPQKAGIPIIAMTTSVSEKDQNAAFAAGMNAFEKKPILIDKLIETIGRFLT